MESDPEQARQDLQKLIAGSEEKNGLIAHLAMRLAEKDVDEAIRWASSLESEEEKSLALGKVALVISAEDPAKAARLLSESGVTGRDFDVSVVQVVQRWASQSPADAAAWVVLFNPGEARTAALKEVISVWAVGDPESAATWISSNPDQKIRQEGVNAVAQVLLDQPDMIRDHLLESVTPEMKAKFEKLKAEADEAAAAEPEDE